jgi:co-chaperonin GroES (HSP10)
MKRNTNTDPREYTTLGKKYKVKGNNLLIEMEQIDNRIGQLGLIVAGEDSQEILQAGHPYGYVRAIGAYCWSNEPEPRAEIGERVTFKRYAGTTVNRLKAGNINRQDPELRIMADYEISCVVEEARDE